jgi:hypothetical protein
VYQQQEQEQQQQQQEQQDAENPFLDPPFSRIKTGLRGRLNGMYDGTRTSERFLDGITS